MTPMGLRLRISPSNTHHDIETRRADLHPREVTLAACRSWRGALDGLTESFDQALGRFLTGFSGNGPQGTSRVGGPQL
jgi:hypothetical protein